jgi:hypothetical protein
MSDESAEPPTVATVLGQTARTLRGDRKAELVARAARLAGLNWGTGRIADLEAGRVSPTLPTLIALCWAFRDLLGRPVELPDLFVGEGNMTLAPGVIVPIALLRKALDGKLADPPAALSLARSGFPISGLKLKPSDVQGDKLRRNSKTQRVERSMLEADYRMAHSVGIAAERAAAQMQARWGRSFTDERDHRAGPDANPQKRGRISRELKAELQESIDRGDD